MADKKDKDKPSKRKLDKLKQEAEAKYRKQDDYFFDATDPRTIPDPTWKKPGDREWLANMSDGAMRAIAWPALQAEGYEDITNEQFCKWLRDRGLWTEGQLACYVMQYISIEEL